MSSATENKAAVLTGKQVRPLSVQPAPMPEPGPNEVILRVHAASINPVDWAVQAQGILIEQFPYILGSDAAGTITAVGSSIKRLTPGDRVVAEASSLDPLNPREGRGAFQLYTPADAILIAKLPPTTKFTEAAILPLCLCTAATALYEPKLLDLPLPKTRTQGIDKKNEVLVIWGVGSAVGSLALQMAKASGYLVAATASAHNLEYARSIGADYVFDYKSPTIVEDVVKSLQGLKSAGVFAASVGMDLMGPALKSAAWITHALGKTGGRKHLATVIPPMMDIPMEGFPEDVEFGKNWGTAIKVDHVGPYLFHEWIPAALADGTLKCKPDQEIVGQGLESVQRALDRYGEGVSAKKLVVEFP